MPEEAGYHFDQGSGATEAAYPDPSDLGLTVKPDRQSLDIAEHAAPDDPKPFPRPDNDEQIQECETLGRQLYEDIKIGKDAEKTGCNTFIDRAVALFHALSEPEREAYLHERNVDPPKAELTSPYLPTLQALYPGEGRKPDKGKLTQWAQIARGVIEGRLAEPERGKIEAFLNEPKGRSRAIAAFKELPDIKAKSEPKAKKAERDDARRENTLEEPHARPDPEKAPRALSSLGPDDLSFVSPDEAVVGGAPLIEFLSRRERLHVEWNGRRVPVDRFNVVPTEDGSVIVLHVPEDDERLAELSEEQAS